MRREAFQELVEKAKSYYGKELIVVFDKPDGGQVEKFYKLIDYRSIGIGESTENSQISDDDYSWRAFAVLEEKDSKDQVNIFPLKKVLSAIDKGRLFYRDYFKNKF